MGMCMELCSQDRDPTLTLALSCPNDGVHLGLVQPLLIGSPLGYIESMAIKGKRHSLLSGTLSIIIILAILGALVALIYSVAVPATSERFTEFYILGQDGTADNYPVELNVNQEAVVIVGIVNREQETSSYRISVRMNGLESDKWAPSDLANGEKREKIISFQPVTEGDNQKVEFLLFKQGQNEIYQTLHLFINVSPR